MLELTHVTKSFGATRAVDGVSLSIGAGEIVGIVGENGAGKTTLMRLIAGELAPDGGRVDLSGAAAFVHQHFMLVGAFSIAENLALALPRGQVLRSRRSLEREATEVIAATGIALADVGRRAEELSVGEKSKLELIKAIAQKPSLLILDEPTSVLTPHESDELFRVVRRLAAAGTAVAFISHKLREVVEIATRVVVMRHGRVVAESGPHGMSVSELAEAMVPRSDVREPLAPRGPVSAAAPVVVDARDVRGERLEGATFRAGRGEIVAIVGVAGNGQAELAAILRGLQKPTGGTVTIDASRVGYIPEDRTRDGIVAEMSIAENIALTADSWSARQAVRRAAQLIALYSIRASSPAQAAGSLSGGNQQKVVLARELDGRPDLIVASEPTRGLDVKAARFVHDQLRAAAAAGAAVTLITSDLDEAFILSDAVYVIYRGRLSERLAPGEARRHIGELMAGVA